MFNNGEKSVITHSTCRYDIGMLHFKVTILDIQENFSYLTSARACHTRGMDDGINSTSVPRSVCSRRTRSGLLKEHGKHCPAAAKCQHSSTPTESNQTYLESEVEGDNDEHSEALVALDEDSTDHRYTAKTVGTK